MRETIPEDLKALYNWTGACSQIEKNQLIERIAKAEARIKEMYAALILIRAYAIREMRQQDIDALEKLLEQVRSEIKPQ